MGDPLLDLWVGIISTVIGRQVYVYDPNAQENADNQTVMLFEVNVGQVKPFNREKIKNSPIKTERNQKIREKAIKAYQTWLTENEEIPFDIVEVDAEHRFSKEDYKIYLRSNEWRRNVERIKSYRDYECEICGNNMTKAVRWIYLHPEFSNHFPEISRFLERHAERRVSDLEVHHKNYDRLGNELDEDLALVCFMCHTVITENAWIIGLEPAWEFAVKYVSAAIRHFNKEFSYIMKDPHYTDYTPYPDSSVDRWLKPPSDIESKD